MSSNKPIFLLLLLNLLAGNGEADYASGTCVCHAPPVPNVGPESLAQGKPGKKGPPGPPGEPGLPDDSVVEAAVDKRFRLLEEEVEKLEKVMNKQSDLIEQLLSSQQQTADCLSVQGKSGIYKVYPPGFKRGLQIFCDQDVDDGGWMVIQRRMDGSVDFYRGWEEYVAGFGDATGEFWIGLETLHRLTEYGDHELRVDLVDMEGNKAFAKYSIFMVNDANSYYTLWVSGYAGDAGDGLGPQNRNKFTTHDMDNDVYGKNCASSFTGAWWYAACHTSNLNGKYFDHADKSAKGVSWRKWYDDHRSMKHVEMKIRPR